jgi:hypothetical protein
LSRINPEGNIPPPTAEFLAINYALFPGSEPAIDGGDRINCPRSTATKV